MLISCLTVTQAGRLDALVKSVGCFARQTYTERELVLVHDGDTAFEHSLRERLEAFAGERIRVVRTDHGHTLGTLRNLSVREASGELVCQWDDDDLYHPRRLEVQCRRLQDAGADFCFFTDQLHWFRNTGEFFWDDWNVERYPMNLIQGTLLGKRCMMPDYPALGRGEDTPLLRALHRRGAKLAEFGGCGYLYIYTYSGDNAWDLAHHGAISAWKRLRRDALEARREVLVRHLHEFDLPLAAARFPHDEGAMIIDLRTARQSRKGRASTL